MGNLTDWLTETLKVCSLSEEVEGYLLGRGAKETTIAAEGIITWQPLAEPSPDPDFRRECGPYGEKLNGYLICPVRSPRGRLLGFEARSIYRKHIYDYRLPESKWTPFWIGTRRAMPALWAKGDVWIVEGLFDLCPLEWVIPDKDAVLASVRAHLTREQLEFLRRFCRGWVYMVYDQDATGRKATHGYVDKTTGKRRPGALDLLQKVGLKCQDVAYSGGKDPGEIWDKGGVAGVRAAFKF